MACIILNANKILLFQRLQRLSVLSQVLQVLSLFVGATSTLTSVLVICSRHLFGTAISQTNWVRRRSGPLGQCECDSNYSLNADCLGRRRIRTSTRKGLVCLGTRTSVKDRSEKNPCTFLPAFENVVLHGLMWPRSSTSVGNLGTEFTADPCTFLPAFVKILQHTYTKCVDWPFRYARTYWHKMNASL